MANINADYEDVIESKSLKIMKTVGNNQWQFPGGGERILP